MSRAARILRKRGNVATRKAPRERLRPQRNESQNSSGFNLINLSGSVFTAD